MDACKGWRREDVTPKDSPKFSILQQVLTMGDKPTINIRTRWRHPTGASAGLRQELGQEQEQRRRHRVDSRGRHILGRPRCLVLISFMTLSKAARGQLPMSKAAEGQLAKVVLEDSSAAEAVTVVAEGPARCQALVELVASHQAQHHRSMVYVADKAKELSEMLVQAGRHSVFCLNSGSDITSTGCCREVEHFNAIDDGILVVDSAAAYKLGVRRVGLVVHSHPAPDYAEYIRSVSSAPQPALQGEGAEVPSRLEALVALAKGKGKGTSSRLLKCYEEEDEEDEGDEEGEAKCVYVTASAADSDEDESEDEFFD